MLNKRLKEARDALHITQEELAEKLGVSPAAIGLYEQGRRNPDYDLLLKMADFFNTTTDYLLGSFNRLSELVNILRGSRTYEQFSAYTGVAVEYLTEICEGTISSAPSKETLKMIYADYPYDVILGYGDLLEAAGYINKKELLEMRGALNSSNIKIELFDHAIKSGLTPDDIKEALEFASKMKKKS